MKSASAFAVTLLAVSLTIGAVAQAASWAEVGDAGGPASPQVTQGIGSLTSIDGSRGGTLDPVDAFLFRLDVVTDLHIQAFALPSFQPKEVTLYDSVGALLQFGTPDLRTGPLAAGLYIIAVSQFEPEDPSYFAQYRISFDQPVSFAEPAAPEPDALLLGGLTLVLLAAIRRRLA